MQLILKSAVVLEIRTCSEVGKESARAEKSSMRAHWKKPPFFFRFQAATVKPPCLHLKRHHFHSAVQSSHHNMPFRESPHEPCHLVDYRSSTRPFRVLPWPSSPRASKRPSSSQAPRPSQLRSSPPSPTASSRTTLGGPPRPS